MLNNAYTICFVYNFVYNFVYDFVYDFVYYLAIFFSLLINNPIYFATIFALKPLLSKFGEFLRFLGALKIHRNFLVVSYVFLNFFDFCRMI